MTNYFEDGEVDMMYLNFSDPWPKSRHEKRRLTYKTFLDTYKQILPENGEIHFKTDNRDFLNTVWRAFHNMEWFSTKFGWTFMPVIMKATS